MFVKLFVVCVLFSSLVYCGNEASCCDVEHDDDDTAWFVYAPPDVSIQCHLALMSLNQNYDPNFTGWGWEVNGCSASTPRSLICGGGTWCDDGGPGGGENAPLDDYDTDFLATICGTLSRSYTRTWYSITSCEDGSGIRSVTQTISIVDTIPPTLAVPADLEYECPPIAPNVNSISQMNNYFGSPDVMEFCQTLTDNDISQNPTTLSAAGVISRTFTVTDGCFTVVDTQTITLVDTTPPVLQRLPNVHYECGQIIDATAPNAQDTCYRTIDAGIPVIMNDVTYEGFCAGKYSMVRTWTASDTDGNTVRETQVIVVDDTIPPVITPTVDERIRIINVDCFSDIDFPYTQEDVCSNVASLNVPYEISLSHNEDEGRTEVLVEYTSADLCGNSQKWADLWQVNSGIGVFSDVISGPYGLVDKGTVFTIIIDITTTNDCVPFGILLVDSGYATLQRGSDACFFQSATGVIYCDPVPTASPYSLVLNLSVPADYLGDDLLVSISWHYNYRTIAVIVGSYLVSFNP